MDLKHLTQARGQLTLRGRLQSLSGRYRPGAAHHGRCLPRPATPPLVHPLPPALHPDGQRLRAGIEPRPLEEWERFLQDYLRFYNRTRLHSALDYATPPKYALQRLPRQARVSHMS